MSEVEKDPDYSFPDAQYMYLCWLHVDQLDDGAKLFQLWRFLGEALILDQVGVRLQGVDDRRSPCST